MEETHFIEDIALFFEQMVMPRVASYRWMSRVSFLAKSTGVFHYRLGEAS